MQKDFAKHSRNFQDTIRESRAKRRGLISEYVIPVPANREVEIDVSLTDILFQFDATYPHPGGEANFGISINGSPYMAFLDAPNPPWELSDFPIFKMKFQNRTAADIRIRFIGTQQPATTENMEG